MKFGNTQYKRLREIGRGTYGTAVLYEHPITKKHYVVKEIPYTDNEITHDILKELDTLRRFSNHPNIVKILRLKVVPKSIQILQSYRGLPLSSFIHDESLDTRLQKAGTVFSQMLSGLDFLHRNNVIHRDIKPANILIQYRTNRSSIRATKSTKNIRISICDFGLSKIHIVKHNTPKANL